MAGEIIAAGALVALEDHGSRPSASKQTVRSSERSRDAASISAWHLPLIGSARRLPEGLRDAPQLAEHAGNRLVVDRRPARRARGFGGEHGGPDQAADLVPARSALRPDGGGLGRGKARLQDGGRLRVSEPLRACVRCRRRPPTRHGGHPSRVQGCATPVVVRRRNAGAWRSMGRSRGRGKSPGPGRWGSKGRAKSPFGRGCSGETLRSAGTGSIPVAGRPSRGCNGGGV